MKIRPESGVNELTSANLSGKALEKKEAEKSKPVKDIVEVKSEKAESAGLLDKAKGWVKTNIVGTSELSSVSVKKYDADYGDKQSLMIGIGAAGGAAVGTAVGVAAGVAESKKDVASKELVSHNIEDKKLVGYDHRVVEDGHYEQHLVGYEPDHYEQYVSGYKKNGDPIYSERLVKGDPIYEDRWIVDGYWHRFDPDIDSKKVGDYKTPEYKHSNGLDPLTGGLLGLVGGTVIGGALGFVVSVINKAVNERGN